MLKPRGDTSTDSFVDSALGQGKTSDVVFGVHVVIIGKSALMRWRRRAPRIAFTLQNVSPKLQNNV